MSKHINGVVFSFPSRPQSKLDNPSNFAQIRVITPNILDSMNRLVMDLGVIGNGEITLIAFFSP